MHNVFTELSLIIAIGAGVALIMKWLKQPLIIGHIITGIIVGPTVLDILNAPETFGLFASIGVALLLFIIGLDLSVKIFSKLGKTVFVTAGVQILTIAVIGYFSSLLLGFGRMESAILGLALTLSSTIIIVKLFNDKKETSRLYAQITIGVLLLQDVVATGAKIAVAIKSDGGSAETISWLLARGIGITVGLYLLSQFVVPKLTRTLESSKELLLLFGLGWGLGFAALFELSGFSIEIGALFAGVSLASLPYSNEMASRLKPLRDFFIVIFFISLGQAITLDRLTNVLWPALALTGIVLVLKPMVVTTILGLQGYTKRASFKAGVSLGQISEFSLVFLAAALASGLVSQGAADTLTLVALITFATSAYLIKYDDSLFVFFERHFKFFERSRTNYEQIQTRQHYPIVLFGFHKGGQEFVKTFRQMEEKFIVVDYNPDAIDAMENQQISYLYGDATDPELLEEMSLDKAKLVVSVFSDFKVTMFLAHWLENHSPRTVFVCSADTTEHAAELYENGASYVMLPHFIGSEKISSFIKRNGFDKTEFKAYREKHLNYLQTHYLDPAEDAES